MRHHHLMLTVVPCLFRFKFFLCYGLMEYSWPFVSIVCCGPFVLMGSIFMVLCQIVIGQNLTDLGNKNCWQKMTGFYVANASKYDWTKLWQILVTQICRQSFDVAVSFSLCQSVFLLLMCQHVIGQTNLTDLKNKICRLMYRQSFQNNTVVLDNSSLHQPLLAINAYHLLLWNYPLHCHSDWSVYYLTDSWHVHIFYRL